MTTAYPITPWPDRTRRPKRAICALGIGVAFVLSACSSDKAAVPSSKPTNPTFTLSEFTVKLAPPTLSSGRVTLTATNVGSDEHELVLVRASAVADLPTKADGSVDEDKISESDKMGEIEHVVSGKTKSADFELAPGTYVAFCNLIDPMAAGSMNGAAMNGTDTSNGGGSGATMEGSTPMKEGMGGGHVHFAQGMYQLITVK